MNHFTLTITFILVYIGGGFSKTFWDSGNIAISLMITIPVFILATVVTNIIDKQNRKKP